MYFRQQTISPEIASEMLTHNSRNRRLNMSRVTMLVNDIKTGNWTETPQPISFDSDGNLLDGQHRLTAIVTANIPVVMTVAYDVPSDAVFDKVLERKTGDALYMRGLIKKELSSGRVVAVVNRYFSILGRQNVSDAEKADFIRNNEDMLLNAISISKTGGSNGVCDKASVQTALFAAMQNSISDDVLRRFVRVANTGFMENQNESSAIVLRNYIMATPAHANVALNNIAACAQMAIRDYVGGVPRRRRYTVFSHVYIKAEDKRST